MRKRKIPVAFLILGFTILLLSQCMNGSNNRDVRGSAYAGSQSCVSCHKEIATGYQQTAHFKTSADFSMAGAEVSAEHRYAYNDSVTVAIERRGSEWYQVEYIHGKEVFAKAFNIAIGSGNDAKSFGYWNEKNVFQLPLTFFASVGGWANSPGFPLSEPYFNRSINARCFECHASYVLEDAVQPENMGAVRNLDKQSLIFGIDCERCHGPAASHVNFHTTNPSVKEAKYITGWNSLPRQRKLDACAVCHSGNDQAMLQSTFAFRPGDTLSNFYLPSFGGGAPEADVHGKQMQLLAVSKCFQMSGSMDCVSCHGPHKAEVNNLAVSSMSCLGCHKKSAHIDCPLAIQLGPAIEQNCIDCHMPDQVSRKISFQLAGRDSAQPYLLRTHRIAVYPEETQKVMRMLADQK